MKIEMGQDHYGVLRARVPPEYEPLGSYLIEDVQANAGTCDLLLKKIIEVEESPAASWEGTGNAHTVTLTHSGVKIETEFAIPEKSVYLTLEQFKVVIEKWRSLIESCSE